MKQNNPRLNPHHHKKETPTYNPLTSIKQGYYGILNELGLVQKQSNKTIRRLGKGEFHGYY